MTTMSLLFASSSSLNCSMTTRSDSVDSGGLYLDERDINTKRFNYFAKRKEQITRKKFSDVQNLKRLTECETANVTLKIFSSDSCRRMNCRIMPLIGLNVLICRNLILHCKERKYCDSVKFLSGTFQSMNRQTNLGITLWYFSHYPTHSMLASI